MSSRRPAAGGIVTLSRLLLRTVLVVGLPITSQARPVPLHRYTYQNWSVEAGLPHNQVLDTARDAELERFDADEWPARVRGADIDSWCDQKRARVVLTS